MVYIVVFLLVLVCAVPGTASNAVSGVCSFCVCFIFIASFDLLTERQTNFCPTVLSLQKIASTLAKSFVNIDIYYILAFKISDHRER